MLWANTMVLIRSQCMASSWSRARARQRRRTHFERAPKSTTAVCRRLSPRGAAFSNCGLSDKGSFYLSHRAHGSLRGRDRLVARPMMASVAGCLPRSAARSEISVARPQRNSRGCLRPGGTAFQDNGSRCFYSVMLAFPPCSRRRFSNCGLSDKGSFYLSHRAHGSLRGRDRLVARPMMAFSNCGLSDKGSFYLSHRAHGSLRGRGPPHDRWDRLCGPASTMIMASRSFRSNCGLSDKGSFYLSHRAHGSLRGRDRLVARPMMAFSNCGLSDKGSFYLSHRDGSLRGHRLVARMASAGCEVRNKCGPAST